MGDRVGCRVSPSLFSECPIPQLTHQGSFSSLSKRRRLWSCLSRAFIPSGRGPDAPCSFRRDALLISGRGSDLKLQCSETGVVERVGGPDWLLQAYCKRCGFMCQTSGRVKETKGQTWTDAMNLFPDTRHSKLENKR